MKDYINADHTMTPGYMRLVRVLVILGCNATIAIAYYLSAFLATLISSVVFILVECISDYATYAGINSTKQNGMTFMRASSEGLRLIESALKGDALGLVFRVIISMGTVGAVSFMNPEGKDLLATVFATLAYTSMTYLLINIVRMITRRLNMARNMFYVVVMAVGYVAAGLEATYTMLHFEESMAAVMFKADVILSVVSIVAGALIALRLINRGAYGYKCGFADSELKDTMD